MVALRVLGGEVGIAPYVKVYQTPAQCLAYLVGRGLNVANQPQAERIISEIGQDRLRPYCIARRDINNPPAKPFFNGISFNDIVELYRFDENLRSVVFTYCAKIETSFKTSIAEVLSAGYGPHPYFLDVIYASQKSKIKALSYITSLISKKLENDIVAKTYYIKHNDPPIPPIWTTKEFMTFGGANIFVGHMSNAVRNKIAIRMGLPDYTILENWISNIVDVRNICAHHGRLFNRGLQKQPVIVRRIGVPTASTKNIAAVIECMNHLVNVFENRFDIVTEVKDMALLFPAVAINELGF